MAKTGGIGMAEVEATENLIPGTGTDLANKRGMQNEISDLFNALSPQTLGLTDPLSIVGVSLLAPGFVMFTLLYLGRELFRPRWRGYWDAV